MKLSIITINYNNADDLQKTIYSVKEQTWQDYEYIIIDGGSKDRSVEIIQENNHIISYWISEHDYGIYNAMNKGIAKAQGEYLLMLNSGDILSNNTILEQVFSSTEHNEDLLVCDAYRAIDGKVFTQNHYPNKITFGYLRSDTISHQATFIKKTLHNTIGLYDENLKFASDWKFFILAICQFNVSYKHLPLFLSICDCSGLTCRNENFSAMKEENNQVLEQYFSAFLSDYYNYDRMKRKSFKNIINNTCKQYKNILKTIIKKLHQVN